MAQTNELELPPMVADYMNSLSPVLAKALEEYLRAKKSEFRGVEEFPPNRNKAPSYDFLMECEAKVSLILQEIGNDPEAFLQRREENLNVLWVLALDFYSLIRYLRGDPVMTWIIDE